ncbi:MAG: CHASE2 domain-containing protein [Desulfobacterales bacterium]|nr:CHASE2 domain-containing protein [Desulfobacterales bacterium]
MPEKKTTTTRPSEDRPGGLLARVAGAISGGHGRPAALTLLAGIIIIHMAFGALVSRPLGNSVFDTYQRLFPRQVDRFPVVIVDIDDASIGALGRWPWPRTRLAKLTDATRRLGALAIGYDIIMPEPDHLSPEVILAHRQSASDAIRKELARLPSNDAILIKTLRQTPSVVARAALIDSQPPTGRPAFQTAVTIVGPSPLKHLTAYNDHLANIPAIEQAAFGCGYLNDTRDRDGVVRTMPLLISVNGKLAPALALELLRTAMGANWYSVHGNRGGVDSIQLGKSHVPTDPDGRIRLYFSPAFADRRVSALAVLDGSLAGNAFANQVAIIGVTGVGTIDVAATPVAARMDGVEIQAQVVENILSNSRLIRPLHAPALEFAIFILLAGLFILFLPRVHPGYGIFVFLVTATLLIAGSLLAFLTHKQLYDPTFPITGSALVVIMLMTAGFAASKRQRRELNAALEAERLERVRISGELQAAREIQMGMLPDPAAVVGLPPHLEFYAMLEPATEVGGDLYDAFMIDDRHFFFIVGDVAGKGVAASLFMALSKTLCKSTALRQGIALDDLISTANVEISRDNPGMLFVTAVAGIIDTVTGETQLCRAGHDAPVLIRPGAPLQSLDIEAGPPLCVLEDYPYPAARVTLQPDDRLLLISDGVTEAQDPAENLYGRERILGYLVTLNPAQEAAESLCQGLYEDVKRFSEDAVQSDDITIMAIRFGKPRPVS